MTYRVLHTFIDPEDGCRLYLEGGTWPPEGSAQTPERVRRLDGSEGRPALIAPVEPAQPEPGETPRKRKAKGGAHDGGD